MFLQKAALQRSSVELTVSYMEIYKDEVLSTANPYVAQY